ncbi:hypothetical protein [Pseudomonas viridiflava]|uniref:hypothetical protein n=1 Tax=Pseudomonas viridiflava TaxID=33069 RepID=UPI002EC53C6F|nr:hypothetical protein [Pseudomonas viridiflava]
MQNAIPFALHLAPSISANQDFPDADLKPKRGPKPKTFSNGLHRHLQVAVAEDMHWFDDYVHGACATVAKAHNGVFRVSPSDVLRVCLIPVISTESVQSIVLNHELTPVSADHARRIAQTARFALGGMALFLEDNPDLYDVLEAEVSFILSYPSLHVIPVSYGTSGSDHEGRGRGEAA